MLVEAEIWTVARTDQGNVILIRPLGMDQAVPIFMGQLETQSILIGLGQVPLPRPLTHDLMLSIMEKSGQQLGRIEITDLQEGTFFARLIVESNGEEMSIDARPSDALGLAVRAKVPILINQTIINEAALPLSVIEEESGQTEDPIELERIQLEHELKDEIDRENYENAARLRDQLKNLEKKYRKPFM